MSNAMTRAELCRQLTRPGSASRAAGAAGQGVAGLLLPAAAAAPPAPAPRQAGWPSLDRLLQPWGESSVIPVPSSLSQCLVAPPAPLAVGSPCSPHITPSPAMPFPGDSLSGTLLTSHHCAVLPSFTHRFPETLGQRMTLPRSRRKAAPCPKQASGTELSAAHREHCTGDPKTLFFQVWVYFKIIKIYILFLLHITSNF